MGGWVLAIDVGTSFTTAATLADGRAEVLVIDGAARLPSLVFLDHTGELTVGRAAVRRAELFPERAERAPKRALALEQTVRLGDRDVPAVDLVAALLRRVYAEALRRHGPAAPDRVVLTYPARWWSRRLRWFAAAAARAGLPRPRFVPEPVAAAVHCAGRTRIDRGRYVAVYDLGAGTFDTMVLRRTLAGFEPVGRPGGAGRPSGEDFDAALLEIVGRRAADRDAAAWAELVHGEDRARNLVRLRHDLIEAKHTLSERLSVEILPHGFPGDLRITRAEFERHITPPLRRSVDELLTTIARAGLTPDDLAAVYVTGGSLRVPKIGDMLVRRLGRPPATVADPECGVALGALDTVHSGLARSLTPAVR